MIIGVTGGIASGKSEVCRVLEEKGFTHIDADDVAHDILENPIVIDEILTYFGNNILCENKDKIEKQKIDRKKLGKIVFNDAQKMTVLERITHPHVIAQIKSIINENTDHNFVIEAIKIVSSGLVDLCDELWVVHAEPEQQIRRMIEKRHLSHEEACERLKSQEIHDWDENKADRIIFSKEPLEAMEEQVLHILEFEFPQPSK